MNRLLALAATAFVSSTLAACGGSKPPAPAPLPADPDSLAPPARAPSPPTAPAPAAAPPAAGDAYDDPTESAGKIVLKVVMPAAPVFPAAKVSETECWKTVGLTGDHTRDYGALIDACGAAAGLVPYTAPVIGKLHSVKDQRDTFTLKLKGGYCYRYFAVADGTIKDLDILIETSDGALIGDDKSVGPVAIIENGKPWCQTDDVEYTFAVKVDGDGVGAYSFGVWAREK